MKTHSRPAHAAAQHEPTEQDIQHRAYLLWLENGRPEGRDLEFWFAAKELLRHHHGAVHHGNARKLHAVTP